MIFFRYLSIGNFMEVCGDLCNVTIGTSYNAIRRIIEDICTLAPEIIKFLENLGSIEMAFRRKRNFPGVVGCINGTQIPVWVCQSDQREVYRNRKGIIALNVQMICGPDCEIYDVVTSWPGSTHDTNIFNQPVII